MKRVRNPTRSSRAPYSVPSRRRAPPGRAGSHHGIASLTLRGQAVADSTIPEFRESSTPFARSSSALRSAQRIHEGRRVVVRFVGRGLAFLASPASSGVDDEREERQDAPEPHPLQVVHLGVAVLSLADPVRPRSLRRGARRARRWRVGVRSSPAQVAVRLGSTGAPARQHAPGRMVNLPSSLPNR